MNGHLDLLAVPGAQGATVLRRQSFAPPVHLSKPHQDAGWLVVNLASPTPGLFAGDVVEARVEVERGARLLLTAPSANRIHTMAGGIAELRQQFRVQAGGALDVWPEYLIPQVGSRYRQNTRMEVEPGGTLLWTESVAPGRAARGEVFAYTELRLSTDVYVGGRQVVRERYALGHGSLAVQALRRRFEEAYYASVIAVGNAAKDLDLRGINALHDMKEAWVGVSRPAGAAVVVKIVAENSPALRRVVERVRGELFHGMGLQAASLRRVTGTPLVA